jgi:NADH-quinone oxidoreductase subunit N
MVMFSLAGIPPLFGFWGKFVVFSGCGAGMIPLATVGIAAVIGAFYYLKVVKTLYFDEPADKVVGSMDGVHAVLLYGSAIVISPWAISSRVGWAALPVRPQRLCSMRPEAVL